MNARVLEIVAVGQQRAHLVPSHLFNAFVMVTCTDARSGAQPSCECQILMPP